MASEQEAAQEGRRYGREQLRQRFSANGRWARLAFAPVPVSGCRMPAHGSATPLSAL